MARFRPMLRQHGLTEQQWRVLRALSEKENVDAGELARRSFLLAPSLTRIVQYLEAEKLLRRLADPADQRRSVFVLTGRGRRRFDAVAPDAESLYDEIEASFGATKLAELYRLLAEFTAAVEDPRPDQR